MKKLIIAAAIVCAAVVSQAAAVGWSATNVGTDKNGNYYSIFVIGQNGVTSIAQITGILDAGTAFTSYEFANAAVSGGKMTVASGDSGKTLGAGTWTEFVVLFDSSAPTAGSSKYCVVSGKTNQTQEILAETAAATFAVGNASSIVNNTANWKSFGKGGDVPEPTSAMLLLLGVAGLALKRKVA